MIIKEVTGSTISAELRRRILNPLGLHRTFLPDEETVSGVIAHPWLDINDIENHEKNFITIPVDFCVDKITGPGLLNQL